MKILYVSPLHGGIGAYARHLVDYASSHTRYDSDLIGSAELTFDHARARAIADELAHQIERSAPDILHLQFGTYDLEQLLLLPEYDAALRNTTVVYTVHNTDWRLFHKMDRDDLYQVVRHRILTRPEAYIFFGRYGQDQLCITGKRPQRIAYHPATLESAGKERVLALPEKFTSFLGYTSRWKDHVTLLRALERCRQPVHLVVAGKWWDEKLGFENASIGNTVVQVIAEELSDQDFLGLIRASAFGVFPYRHTPDFQCSGILPMFMAAGKPAIVSQVGSLPEYVERHSRVIAPEDPAALADALDVLWTKKLTTREHERIKEMYHKGYSWAAHLGVHIRLYEQFGLNSQSTWPQVLEV